MSKLRQFDNVYTTGRAINRTHTSDNSKQTHLWWSWWSDDPNHSHLYCFKGIQYELQWKISCLPATY